jgi:hypothetical protein
MFLARLNPTPKFILLRSWSALVGPYLQLKNQGKTKVKANPQLLSREPS